MRPLLIVALFAGCGSTSAKPAPAAPEPSDVDLCVQIRTALRACTDDYIPALVDARIKIDYPAGIAARGATADSRAALVAEAKEEWKTDGSDEHNRSMCQMIIESTDAAARAPTRPKTKACIATTDCKARVECWKPMLDDIMAGRKASGH